MFGISPKILLLLGYFFFYQFNALDASFTIIHENPKQHEENIISKGEPHRIGDLDATIDTLVAKLKDNNMYIRERADEELGMLGQHDNRVIAALV
ncbi:MAG: hypothetical protein ACRENG_18180, partial [bacterium]